METLVHTLNDIIWAPPLVGLCLIAGLFFSIRSRFVQLRMVPEMWRLIFQRREGEIGLSSFQALTMTLAGSVGTGAIAGVLRRPRCIVLDVGYDVSRCVLRIRRIDARPDL